MRFLAKKSGREAKRFNVSYKRCLMAWSFLFFGLVLAAPVKALTVVERSSVPLQPGEEKRLFVSVKNQTSYTWQGGVNKTSLYLYGSSSQLKHASWIKNDLPATIGQTMVKPGQMATASFLVKAPTRAGTYVEKFLLGTGNQWHAKTVVEISFVVSGKMPIVSAPVIQPDAPPSSQYLAKLLLKPAGPLAVSGNATMSLTYGIKNEGTAIWNRITLKLKEILPNLGPRLSNVRHASWPSNDEAKTITSTVNPGNLSLLDFKIKAPAKSGNYTVRLAMVADGQEVSGGEIDIPVTVTADGYIEPEPVNPLPITNPFPDAGNLPDEPIIRVGLYATDDNTLVVRGLVTGMNLTQSGTTVCAVGAAQEVKIIYDRANGVYKISGSGCTSQSTQYYVAVATDGISPLEVTDISRPVSWLPGANDNKFRGKLELRFTPKTNNVWVINELPIEAYLKGLAETSNSSPLEFQKALLTAARTYAMYHVQHATKHADEYFIVDAKYDQVYRGYGQEARSPNVASGVENTRGLVVTHNNDIAITPYFSRSDGRTRSWNEVWYNDVAWCKSVSVPQDAGKTLWGHGVGMSASGALAMAKEGQAYDQILKYFYTGVALMRWYK